MKKILIIIFILTVAGLVIFLISNKKQAPFRAFPEPSDEMMTFTDKPEHYVTTIAETNYSEHRITLETYPDGGARMFFDYKGTAPRNIPVRQEEGTFRYNDDASQIIVTLDIYGEVDGEKMPYTPPSEFTFIKTETGVEAIAWNADRYEYDPNVLNFIVLAPEDRYAYGDRMEITE